MDKHRAIFQSEVGEIGEQKRHLSQDAFLNGGAENFDGVRVLRPRSAVSLFIRVKTGNFADFWPILRILEILPKTPHRRIKFSGYIQIP